MKARLILVVIATLTLSSFTFLQKSDPVTGLVFHNENYHDALWHVALMGAISRSVPPENPLVIGEKLVGYHYFNDVFWVGVSKLTGISFLTMYLNISPVLLAGFFSLTTLLLFEKVFKNKVIAFLGASIALFGSGFAFIVPLFFPMAKFSQSVFWLDQPVHFGINQQLLLSLSILNIILLLFLSYKKYWLPIAMLSGVVIAIKVYASLALFVAFLGVGIFELIQKRKIDVLKIGVVSILVALPFVLLIGNRHGFPFLWEPGWFLKTMFESGDRLNMSHWELLRLDAMLHHSWHRLILLWGSAFVIFFLGNFGFSLFGFFCFPLIIKKAKQDQMFWWLLLILMTFCFAMPILFLQKGVVWNTIQFLPYCFVPLVLFLVKGVDLFFSSQKKKIFVLAIVLLVSLPTTIQTILTDLKPTSYTTVSPSLVKEIRALSELPPEKTLLLSSALQHNSLIPAIANRGVYVADPSVLSILGNTYSERQSYVQSVELGVQPCKSNEVFVSFANIGYLQVEECPRTFVFGPINPRSLQ